MNCTDVRELMDAGAWLAGDRDVVARLHEHVDSCPDCGRRYGGELQLDPQLALAFSQFAAETEVPASAGRWREQLTCKAQPVRWGKLPAFVAVVAAMLILMLVASPAARLYAGSVPGVGSLLRMMGADRGLLLAADQGLVADVDLTVESSGVSVTVRHITGDASRVVVALELDGAVADGRESGSWNWPYGSGTVGPRSGEIRI